MSSPVPASKAMRVLEWNHLRPELVWIYEGKVPAPYRNCSDHLPGQSAIFLLQGTLTVQDRRGEIRGRLGQWVFPSAGPRTQMFSRDARIVSVHFELGWPGGMSLFDLGTGAIVVGASARRLAMAARRLESFVRREYPGATRDLPYARSDLRSHLRLQARFVAWVSLYAETLLQQGFSPNQPGQIDSRILHAVQNLDRHPLGTPFRHGQLAGDVGVSPSQLDRLFVHQFGMTPRHYLEDRRRGQAILLLREKAASVKQVAFSLGFRSLSHFSRWFKQRTGHSPRRFQDAGHWYQEFVHRRRAL